MAQSVDNKSSETIDNTTDNTTNITPDNIADKAMDDTLFLKIIQNPTYYAIASVIEMIILILIIYKWDPLKISEKYPPLANIFIIMVGFIQLLTYYFINNKNVVGEKDEITRIKIFELISKVVLTIFMICGSILFIYCFLWLLAHIPGISTIVGICINITIILFALALIYLFYKKFVNSSFLNKNKNDLFRLIGLFIMYVPCAIIDVINWFKKQYNITTKTTWLILAIEVVLIALKFILPILTSYLIDLNGTHLLKDPVYLNEELVIGNVGDLYTDDDTPSYNYSLSAWFWINPQPPNTSSAYIKYTNILEFGRKPAIEYNAIKNKLRINCQIKDKKETTIFETDKVDLQKWNNIVVNYDGGNMDVFLNGNLVASQPDVAPYITMKKIKVGAPNGIEGGICNVIYQKNILKERQILLTYKSLSKMNTPFI